jgi:hypothetical protein
MIWNQLFKVQLMLRLRRIPMRYFSYCWSSFVVLAGNLPLFWVEERFCLVHWILELGFS